MEIEQCMKNTIQELTEQSRPSIAFTGNARAAKDISFGKYFDHTLLKPDACEKDFRVLCQEAKEVGAWSVCVPPNRVQCAVQELQNSDVKICTVIGFPFGYSGAAAKAADVEAALSLGASEFDMVIPIAQLLDGNICSVYDDVRAVVAASNGNIVKVILETALLNDVQKVQGAAAAIHAGAAILKTSTGYASGGATLADIQLLRNVAGKTHGVKASGGIRDYHFAQQCIKAGADRIGASATVAIIQKKQGNSSY